MKMTPSKKHVHKKVLFDAGALLERKKENRGMVSWTGGRWAGLCESSAGI